jgi:hypothetical protein
MFHGKKEDEGTSSSCKSEFRRLEERKQVCLPVVVEWQRAEYPETRRYSPISFMYRPRDDYTAI